MKINIKKSFENLYNNRIKNNNKTKALLQLTACTLILIIAISLFVMLSSITQKPTKKSQDKLLKSLITVPVHIKNYRYEFTAYGTVKPVTEIKVSAELKGQIVYENKEFEEGSFVAKGTTLLKIDDTDYQLALKVAETEIISLKLKIRMNTQDIKDGKDMLETRNKALELDIFDLKRKEDLRKKDAISSRSVEEARLKVSEAKHSYIQVRNQIAKYELELESLKADLARSQVKLKQAQKNLKKTVIDAPINGRLENICVTLDEYVTEGTGLFEINDRQNVSIDVPIEIEDALYLMDFQNQNPNKATTNEWFHLIKGITVVISWTGDKDQCIWQGKIVRIRKFNAETRTLTIQVEPVKYIGKNKQTVPLIEGMFCKIAFTGKAIKDTVKIPWASLQLNGGIFIVDKDGFVKESFPEILNTNNNDVIISGKNLNNNEFIVAQRIPQGVVDGTKVKVLTLNKDTSNK